MDKQSSSFLEKAERKLNVSRELLKLGEHEDSVSRAYYAMFFAAKGALASEKSNPKTHSGVSVEFSRLFVKPRKLPARLAKDFDKARSYREAADYSPAFRTTEEVAEEVLRSAEEFVAAVKGYLGGS